MGDRANVYIKDGKSGVYLYTHWAGTDLPDIVRDALKRGRDRWCDGQYLARIIFEEMIKDAADPLTGYGISSVLCDNEHAIIVVNCDTQTIGFAQEGKERTFVASIPFEEYVNTNINYAT